MKDWDKMVLIDTSVWIEYFRKNEVVFKKVNELAEQKRVCCTNLILAELIQGAKSDKEIEVIKDFINIFPFIEERENSWVEAGMLAYKLRKKGKAIGLSDCYIAILSLENDAKVYTFDRHFKEVQKIVGIELL